MEEPCAAYGDVAPADEGVGGVVVDEDGQVDGRAPEGELEVAVPHLRLRLGSASGVRVGVRVKGSECGGSVRVRVRVSEWGSGSG